MKFSVFGAAIMIWVCPTFTNPQELGKKSIIERSEFQLRTIQYYHYLGNTSMYYVKYDMKNISVMLVIKSAIQCIWSQQMFTFLIVIELFRSVPCYHCVNNAL